MLGFTNTRESGLESLIVKYLDVLLMSCAMVSRYIQLILSSSISRQMKTTRLLFDYCFEK